MNKPVNLVIFSSREELSTLTDTLSSAWLAAPADSKVDVLVNGNSTLAQQISHWAKLNWTELHPKTQIWEILAADKGNAWNQHIHHIWQQDLDSIYIDGYVRVEMSSILNLSKILTGNPLSLGASGLPTVGPSALRIRHEMEREGGFHGNLCAIKATALEKIRQRKIFLPLGIYRVDSTMGAFLSFGLDNVHRSWDPFRYIPLALNSTWLCDEKKWYHLRDLIAWKKRRDRQARGDIENSAIRYHLSHLRCPLESLPRDVNSLVKSWAAGCTGESKVLTSKSARHNQSLALIHRYIPPTPSECSPNLMFSSTQ